MNQQTQLIESLKTDLINSLQSKGITSNKTIGQIKIINNGNSQQLQLPGYLQIVEQGRGPTGKNAAKGNPPMIERIQQWCREKGIPDKAAWAIKNKIDKVGYAGKPGVLSEPLGDANINLRLNQSSEKIAEDITAQILKAISL